MKVSETILGQAHGKDVVAYTLTNPNGISLTAMTYGATITELMMPDKNGKSENVILAMDSLDDYVKHRPYYGATIGRIAGRIAKGSFDLDGTRHQLIVNEEENQLHGVVPPDWTRMFGMRKSRLPLMKPASISRLPMRAAPMAIPGHFR